MDSFPLWQEQYHKKLSCTLLCLLQVVASILTMLLKVLIILITILHHQCQQSWSPSTRNPYLSPLSSILVTQAILLSDKASFRLQKTTVSYSMVTQITSSIKADRFRQQHLQTPDREKAFNLGMLEQHCEKIQMC